MANKNYWEAPDETIQEIADEVKRGFDVLNQIPNEIVTFFGSAQIEESEEFYQHCENTAFELGKKGYAIVTGGGPGIMRAANSGASRAEAPSIGIRAGLIDGQQVTENIYSHKLEMEFVFLRRFVMYAKSRAWIFYPGGIGTLDELSECMQLRYTGIRNQKPIICVNEEYWEGLFIWLREKAYKNNFLMHGESDLKLVQFAESSEDVIRIIESFPTSSQTVSQG